MWKILDISYYYIFLLIVLGITTIIYRNRYSPDKRNELYEITLFIKIYTIILYSYDETLFFRN